MQWMDRARGQGHWTLNGGWSVLAHWDFRLHPPIAASVSHVAYPLICTASSVMLASMVNTHEARQPASVGTLDKSTGGPARLPYSHTHTEGSWMGS